MNILYYSKYCPQCLSLVLLLKQNDLLSLINKSVCVDNAQNSGVEKARLPEYVTCVPMIKTNDYVYPLVDEYVFEWIKYKKHQREKKTQIDTRKFPKTEMIMPASANKAEEVMANFEEMQKKRERAIQEIFSR